ncbi:MAG: DUF4421 domain-containing protein [Flavobacteriales bacterium]|nr:DUF4421 domain-containing protein [Flavobacteriales bacterium]
MKTSVIHAILVRTMLVVAALLMCTALPAQKSRALNIDTLFVKDYSHLLTMRLYSSTKFNTFRIGSNGDARDLVFKPNNRINIGLGASYRRVTLNLGFGIPFINNDDARFGRTRYLDAQANILSPERATNLFLQVFKGYYIASHQRSELGWADQGVEHPYRGDLKEFNFGASSLRVYNSRRFSYRAAFNQDAWQRRSQGSWLLGGYLIYYRIRADSSLVPERLAARFDANAAIHKGDFGDVGVMGGYAYTFVYKEHWFATGSLALGPGLSVQRVVSDVFLDGATRDPLTTLGPGWHMQVRAGAGYNSRRDQAGLSFNLERVDYILATQSVFAWSVGNLRLNFVHRFTRRMPEADRAARWLRRGMKGP